MKAIKITSTARLAGIWLLLAVFISCQNNSKDLKKSDYGSIVIGKCQNAWPEYFLTLKRLDSTFVTVRVEPSYYEYYHSGDTIK